MAGAQRRYDEQILNTLMDRYENSLCYTGKNVRRQSIFFKITKSTLPEYFKTFPLEYETVHEQLMEMEQRGYVSLVWKNNKPGHILEKCVLCTEKADDIYDFLHRKSKADKEAELLKICEQCSGMHPVVDYFLDWISERIAAGESVLQYVDWDDPKKLRDRCDFLCAILNNQDEVYVREFSVRFWKDSKVAERELKSAASIIIRFSGNQELQGLDTEQLLDEFHIYKNPTWVMIKGDARFYIKKTHISLSDFKGGLGLSSADIANVCWDADSLPPRVVTIENLTSFHRWHEEGTIAIYLGGYHNRTKREFLQNMYRAYADRDVIFEHFGDIDCGGFRIWRDLREKTGIPISTLWMDEETYDSHLEFGKDLTANDIRELEKMAEDPYFSDQHELFQHMLQCGKKVEQESVWDTHSQ